MDSSAKSNGEDSERTTWCWNKTTSYGFTGHWTNHLQKQMRLGTRNTKQQALRGSSPVSPLREPNKGSLIHDFVSSPLIAEALAVRSSLYHAASLEITSIRVCSDNQTLIRAINQQQQVKEIIGIVTDILKFASTFVNFSASHLSRDLNRETDQLAKSTLRGFISSL